MIDGHDALSISRQAQLAEISRGSVYYVPKSVGAVEEAPLVMRCIPTDCRLGLGQAQGLSLKGRDHVGGLPCGHVL